MEADLDRLLSKRAELERSFLLLHAPTVEVASCSCMPCCSASVQATLLSSCAPLSCRCWSWCTRTASSCSPAQAAPPRLPRTSAARCAGPRSTEQPQQWAMRTGTGTSVGTWARAGPVPGRGADGRLLRAVQDQPHPGLQHRHQRRAHRHGGRGARRPPRAGVGPEPPLLFAHYAAASFHLRRTTRRRRTTSPPSPSWTRASAPAAAAAAPLATGAAARRPRRRWRCWPAWATWAPTPGRRRASGWCWPRPGRSSRWWSTGSLTRPSRGATWRRRCALQSCTSRWGSRCAAHHPALRCPCPARAARHTSRLLGAAARAAL